MLLIQARKWGHVTGAQGVCRPRTGAKVSGSCGDRVRIGPVTGGIGNVGTPERGVRQTATLEVGRRGPRTGGSLAGTTRGAALCGAEKRVNHTAGTEETNATLSTGRDAVEWVVAGGAIVVRTKAVRDGTVTSRDETTARGPGAVIRVLGRASIEMAGTTTPGDVTMTTGAGAVTKVPDVMTIVMAGAATRG